MKTIKRTVVKEVSESVGLCPYCGSMPEIETNVKKEITSTETHVTHIEVYCTACGLSAPFDVWQDFSSHIEEPIKSEEKE